MQAHIVNYYGKSLLCGCKYIHQSLPRMLTVWLNYASRAREYSASDNAVAKTLSQMTKIVGTSFFNFCKLMITILITLIKV